MNYKIKFEELDWITGPVGLRYKLFMQNGEQVRLMEITREFEHLFGNFF